MLFREREATLQAHRVTGVRAAPFACSTENTESSFTVMVFSKFFIYFGREGDKKKEEEAYHQLL